MSRINFCDINGIAKDLDPIYPGAALAKLIKQAYLEKVVVILVLNNNIWLLIMLMM